MIQMRVGADIVFEAKNADFFEVIGAFFALRVVAAVDKGAFIAIAKENGVVGADGQEVNFKQIRLFL